MNSQPMLGSDPEVFIEDSDGHMVPAANIIDAPILSTTGSVVKDGLQVELHPSPAHCRETFAGNIQNCLVTTQQHIRTKNKKYRLSNKFVVDLTEEVLKRLTPEDLAIGCEPDKTAHTGAAKACTIDGTKHFKRYAGGHLHFGGSSSDDPAVKTLQKNIEESIILMDYLVALPWVLLDHSDANKERRKVYGRAGAYRVQPHGLEYRVLSNAWMNHPALMSLTFLLARNALYISTPQMRTYNFGIKDLMKILPLDELQTIINENDHEKAEKYFLKIFAPLVAQTALLTPSDVNAIWLFHKKPELNIFMGGTMAKNWGLGGEGFVSSKGWNRFKDEMLINDKFTPEYNKHIIL